MDRGFDVPELHDIGLGENALHRPPRELARVVLHLGGHDGAALRDQLRSPVQSAAAALRLAVELVERVDGHEMIVAADGVLLDGVELGSHDQVYGILLGGRQIEATVLVDLGRQRLRLLGGVVEGVLVGHLHLLRLEDDLVGKVVVDVGGLLRQRAGLVDAVLASLGRVERRVGGVLVDGDHVQRGVIALVQEELVALADNDDVPGVDGAGGAHEHGEDAVGREDGRLVLVGQLLDDGVRGGGDVVRGAVERGEFALVGLGGRPVVGPVVVVQEAVGLDVVALVRLEIQLGQTVEINLLQQLPVGLDVDRRIPIPRGLVVVLPAEAPGPRSSVGTSATAVAVAAAAAELPTTAGSLERLPAGPTVLASSALAAATPGEDGTAPESRLSRVAGVGDNGEGGLVLAGGSGEEGCRTGTVYLLVFDTGVSNFISEEGQKED